MNKPKIEIIKKCYMLYPDEIFKITWELIISLILLISVFLTPYQLAFPDLED